MRDCPVCHPNPRQELEAAYRENHRLRAQVTELQSGQTKLVESSLARRVRAFHLRYGHPVRTTPEIPPDEEVRFRLALIAEEFLELFEATFDLSKASPWAAHGYAQTREFLEGAIRGLPYQLLDVQVELEDLVDALADLDYVVEGTRAVLGVDGAPIAAEVHRANMDKEPNDPKDGKPRKPEGWRPPEIRRLLEEMGYRQ